MLINLRRAIALSIVMIVLCIAYTYVETGIGQVFFRHQADGSLSAYGSPQIAQTWTSPKWFIGRNDTPNPLASGATNYGPRSIQLYQQVQTAVAALRKDGITATNGLVTGSGSGLDPDIAPADAYAQVDAVAKANGLPVAKVHNLVASQVVGRYFGFFGAPYVNVLLLNEALAKLKS